MVNQILFYLGSALPIFWGVAHLFPTRSIVEGFGDISQDNKRIITMEWLIEGISLAFIGLIISFVTYLDYTSMIAKTVYWLCFTMLNTLSVISLSTGFKINFLPFKLCPLIFTSSSILLMLGMYI